MGQASGLRTGDNSLSQQINKSCLIFAQAMKREFFGLRLCRGEGDNSAPKQKGQCEGPASKGYISPGDFDGNILP